MQRNGQSEERKKDTWKIRVTKSILPDFFSLSILRQLTVLQGGRSRVRFPHRQSFLHNAQTGSGAHPASYLIGTGILTGRTMMGHEVDRSPPSSAEVKNGWSLTCK